MGNYSIKDLEKLSGIKAHTIRIWEKRHRLIEPQRSSTNIRSYSDNDLKKIINVSMLNASGMKISRIAGMSDEEIRQKITELSRTQNEAEVHINDLVAGMVELDEEKFERTLSGFVLRFGFEQTVTSIIYPFLEKIGILWQTQHITPAQEHFISNLIRQKMIVAIDALPIAPITARRALLFLPDHELHEIGLLFAHYRIRKAGWRTFYLGQAVPYGDLKSIYKVHKPDMLVTAFVSAMTGESLKRYINSLAADFSNSTIVLTGFQVQQYKPHHQHVHVLTSIAGLDLLI
ncbi:MerR family transcriptional regulator [Fulvivirgaceae bacterium PWU4]|uniref:MerR family transcriptional regulator n=1 Tax=Chryseosolibacter histidini TaxID=2782349 RepID=A0AAP2DG83_9BACT|nr:MerR family transcriptional regulator [Chryseosolibacter histidini]MBT1695806.1 MerR family transcriptional regulator [Chryseosolibacter histidini]